MLPLSMGAHALAALAVLVIPLAAEVELPAPAPLAIPHFLVSLAAPPPPVAPAYRGAAKATVNRDAAPTRAPEGIQDEKPRPPAVPAGVTIVDGGLDIAYGVPHGTGSFGAPVGIGLVAPPPPPPAPTPKPVRVGHGIREPRKVTHVTPIYPSIARDNGVQGVVILEAVINERGTIDNIRVLRSVPLLDHAAVEAVRQWRYTPTLLNGVPVPVLMTITVQFTVQR
jgi:protein TonB